VTSTTPIILCLNSGSSSSKFSVYRMGGETADLLSNGAVERIGLQDGHFWIRGRERRTLADLSGDFPHHVAAVKAIFASLEKYNIPAPAAVGHRVVHGGPDHTAPERVTPQLLDELRALAGFAPLHLPAAIQGIEAVTSRFPGLPQIACFDTAFHRQMPELAQRFPLPRKLWDMGLRRYGFHGLSYEYIMKRLGTEGLGRVIIAHLGNGSSMAAVRNGKPMETTMGFTPTGGVMMGTRSGDLDPGVLLYLLGNGYDAKQLDHLVNDEAGLLGVSGISSDMKTLLEKKEREKSAAQAVELFCYSVRKHLGALTTVLGGLDTLVFTGGIGERTASVRGEVCRGLEYLGIRLDPTQNNSHADIISMPESSCTVRVIPTHEDLMIAQHTQTLIFSSSNGI
jgi:acetate kinase